ncbi:SRPBCC family protein [Fulvimarina sp. 2208YS6-2-32]|uniref:SRPBCC family protein n=1 Tax=Fulvimarina uroteuthidis TaxID=3098149 RepID=A0ABU5HWN4_9HYPH|nr:SRPBCC family protein [Fulvimarina sp. 2208YS6-2-32]MDY8107549.1 SRPBCC family protein [Fulvimarina sp. 2208YS6-2-32]
MKKNLIRVAAPLAGLMLFATPALALEVTQSAQIEADPAKLWSTVGGFCAIADWHPAVTACEESEVDGTQRRTLSLEGGGTLVEDLVSRDDDAMTYTYRIVEGPLPVANYESTISVSGNDNLTTLAWDGTFDAAEGATDEEAIGVITGIYDAGIKSIAGIAAGE